MKLDITERRPSLGNSKKETRECYNYGIKEHLIRDYWKLKIELESQKKKQAQKKPQK